MSPADHPATFGGQRPLPPLELARVTALAHALPHADLRLDFLDGRELRVGRDGQPRPVLTPCLLRRAVVEHRTSAGADAAWVGQLCRARLGGAGLDMLGPGVYGARVGARPLAVLATWLPPELVCQVAEEFGPRIADLDRARARLCVDEELRIALVSIEWESARPCQSRLGTIASELHGRLMTFEALVASSPPVD